MKTIILSDETPHTIPCVATIGMFDGVHRGHQYLLSQLADEAHAQGVASAVITFDRHPREALRQDFRPQLLSSYDEKLALLAQTGVDRCVVLPFNHQLAALSARDFMRDILRRQLGVQVLLTGYDNRFGHNRAEGFDDYVRYGRELDMEVKLGQPLVVDGVSVSSSVIRSFLHEGDVGRANGLLGYTYSVKGTVVSGEHIGTKIGFPTANLRPDDPCKLVPAAGVYAVKVRMDGESDWLPAMMNIGTRPTFNGRGTSLEAHIFHFRADIYGRRMEVAFVGRLRGEQKFGSPDELVEQLRRDAIAVEEQFRNENHQI